MQPGGRCAYPTAQPRTGVLLVLAIIAQATPCLTPARPVDGRGRRQMRTFAPRALMHKYTERAACALDHCLAANDAKPADPPYLHPPLTASVRFQGFTVM